MIFIRYLSTLYTLTKSLLLKLKVDPKRIQNYNKPTFTVKQKEPAETEVLLFFLQKMVTVTLI